MCFDISELPFPNGFGDVGLLKTRDHNPFRTLRMVVHFNYSFSM